MSVSAEKLVEITRMLRHSTILASGVAKLHLASPDPGAISFISPDSILFQFPNLTDSTWTDSEVFGALVLVSDQAENSLLFQIYSLNQKDTILFEYELYEDIDYQRMTETFFAFEMEDCVAGFAFADARIAGTFFDKVQQVKPKSANALRSSKKKKGGILPKFRKKKKFSLDDIGDVTNVEHKGHIGVNKEGDFDVRNIPQEWKIIFKQAGIKKKDLKDAETAQEIFRTIQNEEMNSYYRQQPQYKHLSTQQLEEMYTPSQRIQFEQYQYQKMAAYEPPKENSSAVFAEYQEEELVPYMEYQASQTSVLSSNPDLSRSKKNKSPPVPPPRKQKNQAKGRASKTSVESYSTTNTNNHLHKLDKFESARKPNGNHHVSRIAGLEEAEIEFPPDPEEFEEVPIENVYVPKHPSLTPEGGNVKRTTINDSVERSSGSSQTKKKSGHYSFLRSSAGKSDEKKEPPVQIVEKVVEVVKYEKSEELQEMERQMKKALEEAEKAKQEALRLAEEKRLMQEKFESEQKANQQRNEMHQMELAQIKQQNAELEAAKKREEAEKLALAAAKAEAEKAKEQLLAQNEMTQKEKLEAQKNFLEAQKKVKDAQKKVEETEGKLKEAEKKAKAVPALPPKLPIIPVLPPLKKKAPKLPKLPDMPPLPPKDDKEDKQDAAADKPKEEPKPEDAPKTDIKPTEKTANEKSRPTLAPSILDSIKGGVKLAPVKRVEGKKKHGQSQVIRPKQKNLNPQKLSVRLKRFSVKNPDAANNLMANLAEVIKQRRMKMSGQASPDDDDNDSEWSV